MKNSMSVEEFKSMSPEELNAYSTKLAKRTMIRFAIITAVSITVHVGVTALLNRIDSNDDTVEEN